MREEHPLSDLARTAGRYATTEYQRAINTIGEQAVVAAGFDPKDQWIVDFDRGIMYRDVPDTAPKSRQQRRAAAREAAKTSAALSNPSNGAQSPSAPKVEA